jgi:hypothetical protein
MNRSPLMKKRFIIGGVILALVVLVLFSRVRERNALKEFFVENSCSTDVMGEFHRATISTNMDGPARTRFMVGLFNRFGDARKKGDYSEVMELSKEDQAVWVDKVTHEIRESCPAKFEAEFDLRCYVFTMFSFSNPYARTLTEAMRSDTQGRDIFKGLCVLG